MRKKESHNELVQLFPVIMMLLGDMAICMLQVPVGFTTFDTVT